MVCNNYTQQSVMHNGGATVTTSRRHITGATSPTPPLQPHASAAPMPVGGVHAGQDAAAEEQHAALSSAFGFLNSTLDPLIKGRQPKGGCFSEPPAREPPGGRGIY